jgi:hypothetical protein
MHLAEIACAGLLLILAINMFAVISQKGFTNDEIVHIPAGYYHLVAGEFQPNNEHPPLIKMWAALPLLFIQPQEAPLSAAEKQGVFNELTWSYEHRFWQSNQTQFARILFWARAMMIVMSVGFGMLIFAFARPLFGARAAVFAVALYTLEPTVLAHGRLVHTDLPAAFAFLFFFFALRIYFQARTTRNALLLGLAGGLALLTKFSMIVLLPVLACLALSALVFAPRFKENRRRILLHIAIVVCLVWVMVNAAYRFQGPAVSPGDVQWVQERSPDAFSGWMTFFDLGSRIVPTYYLFGAYNVMLHNRDGHTASLLGQYGNRGWWYYFPVAFALKTSLPFLIVAVLALGWILWRLFRRKDKSVLWLIVPILIYAALSMSSHINIGIRHFLPVYPFLFVAGGALLARLSNLRYPRHLAIAFLVLVFGWMAVEALRAYPNYLPYMNQLASSHPHWWYLSDSNVEWGEDNQALVEYLHARGETEVVAASLGSWGPMEKRGIAFHEIFPKPGVQVPNTRYVAIGASYLNGSTIFVSTDGNGKPISDEQRVNYLAAFRTRQPEAILGNTIYVFRMR